MNRTRRIRRSAGVTMAAFALIAAVISYSDGLLLIRLAGVTGRLAYLYPLLPDGLIVISSLSLYEAAVTGTRRPRWAMAGIFLGAGLTVAMNVAAGWSVSLLAAVADGFVPVVFFVALEILIGLIRRGRVTVPAAVPAQETVLSKVPSSVLAAAEASMAATYAAGNPWRVDGLRRQFPSLTRAQATEIRDGVFSLNGDGPHE